MLSTLKTAIAELIIRDQVITVVIMAICCEFKSLENGFALGDYWDWNRQIGDHYG